MDIPLTWGIALTAAAYLALLAFTWHAKRVVEDLKAHPSHRRPDHDDEEAEDDA